MRKTAFYMSLFLLSVGLTGCRQKTAGDSEDVVPSPSSVVTVSSVVSNLDLTDDTQPELASITPSEVFRNEQVSISTDSLDSDSDSTFLFLNLENLTDQNMYLVCESASINGILLDCTADMELPAGEKVLTPLSFSNTDLNTAGIHTIASVSFKLSIYSMDTSEELSETDQIEISTSLADSFTQDIDTAGQILYDKDGIQLIAKGATLDSDNSPVVVIMAINHSDREVLLGAELAGKAADTYETAYSYTIPVGMAALTYLNYYDENGDVASDIRDIPAVLTLLDTSDWSEIGRTEALSFNSSIIEAYLKADDTEDDKEKENEVSYSGEDAANAVPQDSAIADDAAADAEGSLPDDETDADGDYTGIDEHEGDYLSEDDY